MIRVLQVLGGTNLGGAESRIMDIYRHIDREKIQFDFLVTAGNDGYFSPEIKSLGGNVYTIPKYRFYNHFQYINAVKSFFAKHTEFSAVHGHMTSTAAMYLPIAKKSGVPLTIAHARSAGVDKGIKGKLTRFLRRKLSKKCDMMIACSDLAGISVFGKKAQEAGKVVFMPNGIDTDEYRLDTITRDKLRQQYRVEDKLVIGHVGRFHYAKNHEFLIKVFAEVLKIRDDAVLMIVGDGSLRLDIERWVDENGVKEKVILTGNQSPVAPFFQTFDCMLFPSRFEGMPGTVVEAQAAGVPCLISDTITPQVKASELVEFMSLNSSYEEWAQKLVELVDDKYERPDLSQTMYDVNNQIAYYTDLYTKAAKEKDNK